MIQDVTCLVPKNTEYEAYARSQVACDKAEAACRETRLVAAHDEALIAHDEARKAYMKAIWAYLLSFDVEAFHALHCHPNCPWNGKTIFSKGRDIGALARGG